MVVGVGRKMKCAVIVYHTIMSRTQGHAERDAAPVRREEIPTLVPQALLGQLGLGVADPEATKAQGAEEIEVRVTPELFGE